MAPLCSGDALMPFPYAIMAILLQFAEIYMFIP